MLPASRERILAGLDEGVAVLDVGGWGRPLARADWVIDLMPYETRGLYGEPDPHPERFTAATWVTRDICSHDPWPFADDQFDFVVCSHTLEDVRDPVWVCAEMNRVGKAGYVEVPARVEEQTFGMHGPWVGWSHHHWLTEVSEGAIEFILKPHLLHGRSEFWVDRGRTTGLGPEDRVSTLFWEGSFEFSERIFFVAGELHEFLAAVVTPENAFRPEGKKRRRISGLRRSLRTPA